MAKKKKKPAGADIDWYLISIDRLKQIGLVVLIVLLGGGAYWFWQKEQGNPKENAENAIAQAKQSLNALAASKEFSTHRSEFDRAQKKLTEANTLLAAARFAEAQGAAVESQTISQTAISGGQDRDNDAQFLTVEGDVQFQRSATSDWKKADARAPLFNGDWVKTGDRASAELMFSNGSLYTIGPNALLEIYSAFNPDTSKKNNEVKIQVGSVEVATPQTDDVSAVRTPGTQIVVESESTTQVGVDSAKETDVVATKGAVSVTSTAGGEPVRLAPGQKVTATPAGSLSTVRNVALPPALLSPADNQVFQVTPDTKVTFAWAAQPAANGYQLQVSRSRLFATSEINSRRKNATASAKISQEGAFYWRVASVGPTGEIGPFSPFRRFRGSGGGKAALGDGGDRTPPPLTYKKTSLGGQYWIVEGSTEPGATVFINDEEVDVDSNGAFKKVVTFAKVGQNPLVVKAVDAAGNPTIRSDTVFVNED